MIKIFVILVHVFLFFYIILGRFFKILKTNLSQDINRNIINIILDKEIVFDNQNNDLFMIKNTTGRFLGNEYIVVMCRNNYIYIKNSYTRTIFPYKSKKIRGITNGIKILVKNYKKKQLHKF